MARLLNGTLVKIGYLGMKARDYQGCGHAMMRAAGDLWQQRFKKLHFQMFAFGRYGYHKRTAVYEATKAREHPEAGGRPLVFSGDSEKDAMGANEVRTFAPSSTRYRAEVVIEGPNLNFHAAEMTRTIPTEIVAMTNAGAMGWEREFTAAAHRHGHSVPLNRAG